MFRFAVLAVAWTAAGAHAYSTCGTDSWVVLNQDGELNGLYTPARANATLPGCSGEVYFDGMHAVAYDGSSWNWGNATTMTCDTLQGVELRGAANSGELVHPGNEHFDESMAEVGCVNAPATVVCDNTSWVVISGVVSPLAMNGLYTLYEGISFSD